MFYNFHIEKRFMRPTWAEVSLSALQQNFRTLQDHVEPHAIVCAVVKADAYGHGSVECARALQQAGCGWFGVSSPDEGLLLRNKGITGRILLMAGFWRGDEIAIVEHDLTPAVWEWSHIELLEDAAHKCYGGRLRSPRVPVHLKVDTGMGRLGLCTSEIGAFATTIKAAEYVFLEGLFTHLASAEVTGAPDTDAQVGRFEDAVSAIIENGLSPTYYHMANSAAIAGRQNTWRNMVRPGISLYGYYLPFTSAISGSPDPSVELQVKPVLTWKTRIHAVRDFPAKSPIGYNAAYITSAPARIAVLPVGYADGLSRQLSSQGRVIVRNDYAPIVGIVSMDMTMIDVTGIPGADIGDEVILLGSNGERSISAWEHANLAHTIPYETLCNISKRVPRKYVE
jgi:alanine racemase